MQCRGAAATCSARVRVVGNANVGLTGSILGVGTLWSPKTVTYSKCHFEGSEEIKILFHSDGEVTVFGLDKVHMLQDDPVSPTFAFPTTSTPALQAVVAPRYCISFV
ncbi:hypothetical protein NL676_022635 [Syzygium grande]|nr:hypothetical protein NL676_022635 [Syzygium grande]